MTPQIRLKGYSARELAEMVGIVPTTLSLIEMKEQYKTAVLLDMCLTLTQTAKSESGYLLIN